MKFMMSRETQEFLLVTFDDVSVQYQKVNLYEVCITMSE